MFQTLQLVIFVVGGGLFCFAILDDSMAKWRKALLLYTGLFIGLWPFLLWFALFVHLSTGHSFANPDVGALLDAITKQYWSPYLGFWILLGGLVADLPHLVWIVKNLILNSQVWRRR